MYSIYKSKAIHDEKPLQSFKGAPQNKASGRPAFKPLKQQTINDSPTQSSIVITPPWHEQLINDKIGKKRTLNEMEKHKRKNGYNYMI